MKNTIKQAELEAAMNIVEAAAKEKGGDGLLYWVDSTRRSLLPHTVPPSTRTFDRELIPLRKK